MARNLAAVLIGLFVGNVLNGGLIAISSTWLYPVPPGFDFNDAQQMAAYIKNLPTGGFVMALVAHNLQAFGGGWVAARLGASRPMFLAGIIGALTLAGAVYNLVLLPGPAWMWVDVPLILALTWRAGRMEVHRRAVLARRADPAAGEPTDANHGS